MAEPKASLATTEPPHGDFGAVSTVTALSESLRSRILDGEFRAGHQLREVQLAAEYGVARQSIRAALHQLSQHGLLAHQPNRGVFIPEMTSQDIADIFVLRTAIEAEAVRLLTLARRVDTAVTEAYTQMAQLPPTASWGQVIRMDLDFHFAVIRSTGSRRLTDTFAGLMQELQLSLIDLKQAELPSGWLQDSHLSITEAIMAGDDTAAIDLVRSHILGSAQQLQEIHNTAQNQNTPQTDNA